MKCTLILSLALAVLAAPAAIARPDVPSHRSADSSAFAPRPVLDRPSAPATSRPAATPAAPAQGDHGIDLAPIGIGLAAGLLAAGAAVGVARQRRSVSSSTVAP
jgi:hypothetical protein